jgi:NADP-dependent 3-hydroxy acid dehydrogenase YdfG
MAKNEVAVITGGGTGIGASTALELAEAGMSVVINGRRPEPLEEIARCITEKGGTAVAFPADTTDWDSMQRMHDFTMERFGRVDLVVPNASVHDVALIAEGDPNWWKTLININVVGLMNTIRAFLPTMIQQKKGHIVVVSSASGRITYVGEASYCASKHAQVAFIDCLRKEAVRYEGIKISIIEPGMVETPMLSNEFAQELKKTVPPLDAEEVARVVRFIYEQSPNCGINEVVMRPIRQEL